jgi:hypothetical protein
MSIAQEDAMADLKAMPARRPPSEAELKKLIAAQEKQEKKQAQQAREAHKKMQVEQKKIDANKKAAPAAAKPVDVGKRKAVLLRQIDQYTQKLGHKLKIKVPKRLGLNTKVEELQSIVDSIETDLGMTGGIDQATAVFAEAGGFVEMVCDSWNPLGLQLSAPVSLDRTLRANQEQWQDLVTEFAIKYQALFCTGVEMRMLMFVGTLVATVHRTNAAARRVQQSAASGKDKEEASPELAELAENL